MATYQGETSENEVCASSSTDREIPFVVGKAEQGEGTVSEEENTEAEELKSKMGTVTRLLRMLKAPKHQNIQAEFGGKKPFVIQGDTLAVELYMDQSLHKGQMLHFIYIVERFLLQFTERGGEIHLVFFDSFRHVLERCHPGLLLARECLRLHMAYNAPENCIHTWSFPSQWHPDWTEFLNKHAISFVVMGDGLPIKKNGHRRLRIAFEIQELWFTAQQLSCTMIAGVGVRSNQIWGYHNVAGSYLSARILSKSKNVVEYSESLCAEREKPESYTSYIKSIASACLSLTRNEAVPLNLAIGGAACNLALKVHGTEENVNLCRLYLLHLALLKELPLSARAQSSQSRTFSESVSKVLDTIQFGSSDILKEVGQAIPDRDFQGCPSFADMMDVRLFAKLMQLMDDQYRLQDGTASFKAQDISSLAQKNFTTVWERFMAKNLPDAVLQISASPFPITFENPRDLLCEAETDDDESDSSDDLVTDATHHVIVDDDDESSNRDSTDEQGHCDESNIDDGDGDVVANKTATPALPSDAGKDNNATVDVVDDWLELVDDDDVVVAATDSISFEDDEDIEIVYQQEVAAPERLLLPIKSPLVDEFVGDIKLNLPTAKIDDPKVRSLIVQGNDFDEKYHWHSGKPLADDFELAGDFKGKRFSDDPWKRRWENRSKQTLARYNRWYGETLEGELYKPETIIVDKTGGKKGKSASTTSGSGAKGKKIKEENIAKKEAEAERKEKGRWESLLSICKTKETNREFLESLNTIDSFLNSCKHRGAKKEAIMYKIKIIGLQWKDHCKSNPKNREMALAVNLVSQIHFVLKKFETDLTAEDRKSLATHLAQIGFQDDALKVYPTLKAVKKDEECSVGMSSIRFQMIHMGHHLHREELTDPDPRVSNFIPDMWQRELLDVVDNNQSALIVAPTSSGKTFASYYCIEKVLRQDNEGTVIYVAPTKALVNQVAAVVYARFHRKEMPPGRAVFGTFTRDYRQDPLTCQVLITVPQCLEILLLSPKRQDWVKRMRYVIFDEIHCLGGEIGAEVWEHLLMMIRCPFLALSATINNPQDLVGWLQGAANTRYQQDVKLDASLGKKAKKLPHQKEAKHYRVQLVVYSKRHSDLIKHDCFPGSDSEEFLPLHPIGTLSEQQLLDLKNLPGDMSLSVAECIRLYDVMVKTGARRDTLRRLDPDVYFDSGPDGRVAISRQEVRQYEEELKVELVEWVKNKEMNEEVKNVMDTLSPKRILVPNDKGVIENRESQKYLRENFMPLLKSLNQQKKLPCLVFMFDRQGCEKLANAIAIELEREEKKLRKSELLQPMFSAIDNYLKQRRKMSKQIRDKDSAEAKERKNGKLSRQPSKGNTIFVKMDEIRAILNEHVSSYRKAMQQCLGIPSGAQQGNLVPRLDSLEKPLPNCTFAAEGHISDEEWKKIIDHTRLPEDHPFIRCLKRGIAYHHAGLGQKRKVAVEVLFRKKFLKVVVATGTLALGIHMPCKSVIFAGDSPYLTPIQYRQMSGRAGRRGYDIKGDIYFYGIADVRIRQLMSSGLPDIQGNFPVTATCVLRLMLICSTGQDPDDAVKRSLVLLRNPLMCYSKPQLMLQVRHHFLFCVQFLMRQGLLDEFGTPQGLAGLATHIHYHEPSNFVLVYFLQKGLFHKLCKPMKNGKFSEQTMRSMVTVLANLFGRRFIGERFLRQYVPKSSVVKLPTLPRMFSAALTEYNSHVDSVFKYYLEIVSQYVDQQRGSHDVVLPLSGLDFNIQEDDNDELTSKIKSEAFSYQICSSFAALSGNNDDDVANNENCIPHGVYCESSVLPKLLEVVEDTQGNAQFLNAYALDFFKHGSATVLESDNNLMAGEVYELLKDFLMVIMSISVAVDQLGPEEDNVIRAFRQLREEYHEKFGKCFEYDKTFKTFESL